MDPVAGRIAYPRIPFTDGERQREEDLKKLAKTFQEQMDRNRNPCALKGGTALRFKMGLPRPSTDLDFEGDQVIKTRANVKEAVRKTFPNGEFSVGWDWLRRGTMSIKPTGLAYPNGRQMGFDYRQCGSLPGMTKQVRIEKCDRVDGILIYNDKELVNKKLQTIVGPKPRRKARDIYDTGWIVAHHRDLVSNETARRLLEWMKTTSPEEARDYRNRMRADNVIGRIDADEVWQQLLEGLKQLGIQRNLLQRRPRPDTERGHDASAQDSKRPTQPRPKARPTRGNVPHEPPKPPRPASEGHPPSDYQPPKGPQY